MLEPKKTLVGLAGQKAWHICTGEATPRKSGKYLPSQLRTQNAGPEPLATVRGCGAGWLLPNRSESTLAGCPACCGLVRPPNRKSNKPSAAAIRGINATAPISDSAARETTRRRFRGNDHP